MHRTKHAGNIIRHDPHATIDQADISSSAAKTDLDGLQKGDRLTGLCQMEGSGKAGISATDDYNVGCELAGKRLRHGRSRRCLFPKSMGARIIQHWPVLLRSNPIAAHGAAIERSFCSRRPNWLYMHMIIARNDC